MPVHRTTLAVALAITASIGVYLSSQAGSHPIVGRVFCVHGPSITIMKTQTMPQKTVAPKTTASSKKSPAQKEPLNTTTAPKKDVSISKNPPSRKSLSADEKKPVTNSQLQTDEIASRAYKIWQQQGCPEGCEDQHWRQAEQEVVREGSTALVP